VVVKLIQVTSNFGLCEVIAMCLLAFNIMKYICVVHYFISLCLSPYVQDSGCIQLSETGKLKSYVHSDPVAVRNVESRVPSLVFDNQDCHFTCMVNNEKHFKKLLTNNLYNFFIYLSDIVGSA